MHIIMHIITSLFKEKMPTNTVTFFNEFEFHCFAFQLCCFHVEFDRCVILCFFWEAFIAWLE